ncbi:major cardiolipin synthase ClsA [Mediterraneibacter butyricigenes]|uniref:Cardiolipin synthase n=2 Tax=Mediterraneibacter butyricigenes TaxID=2316025 RepID=A0A391P2P1_9FIRM|nr:cardiolipin synthase [Mediterraneibacter butyricigenes]RGO23442.1 cardiolipin synthase [Dorea sp. OM02-2LB]RGV97006.1 cardiolipin synthase [Ruminococcus sp. AF14-10]GCA67410.1 major cardiolipin synthase ClsA [Mediterraneibacter butyricigenes]
MLTAIANVFVQSYQFTMEHLLIINILLSLLIIFFQRRSPQTVWTWLLVLYFIPILGFVLYLIIGQDFHKSHMFKMKEIEGELKYAVRRQEEHIYRRQLRLANPAMERFRGLILYNLEAGEAVLTDNNDVQIYTDGRKKFEALLREIYAAQHYIHMQYYIIKNDELWQTIEKALIQKAREGVEVRILFDSMGCRTMRNRDWERLEKEGILVAEFFPALLGQLQLRVNYRNHRKIVVIDGRVGFVGGFNIGREYIGRDKKFGYWRDTHLCIEGSAVTTLAVRFVLDWNYAAKENLFLEDHLFELPTYQRNGHDLVQVISSGPDSKTKTIHDNYLQLIHSAKHHIYLQTPYFIPDESILNALQIASRSGIDVRIMIPSKPDHPFVYWATYSYLGEMVAAGAKCYVYNNGFLHAKTLCVDGMVGSVGTANMDIRSFELNFEVNAVIYSERTVQRLERAFEQDIEKCTQITRNIYDQRNMMIRAKEQFSRLLSPLL